MQRALSRLSRETFDLLIIGGGATGCFTARDAAMRGLSVALIEARDFACATSAHNSKLAHGGLRYLRNFELSLVRESLRERLRLMRIAPHLVRPLPFLLPLYGAGFGERAKLAAGLSLYDLLSFDRNRLDDPGQHLPGHRWLNVRDAVAREPVLEGAEGLVDEQPRRAGGTDPVSNESAAVGATYLAHAGTFSEPGGTDDTHGCRAVAWRH